MLAGCARGLSCLSMGDRHQRLKRGNYAVFPPKASTSAGRRHLATILGADLAWRVTPNTVPQIYLPRQAGELAGGKYIATTRRLCACPSCLQPSLKTLCQRSRGTPVLVIAESWASGAAPMALRQW